MPAEVKKEIELEIAYVLFIDIVGYSKLLIERAAAIARVTQSDCARHRTFRKAEANGRLITVPTGDGMALVFYNTPEAPVECALEISSAAREHPELKLRMGMHSGPVSGVVDVSGRSNIAGAGINIAQRVMDCGDAGHILVSKHVAEDLEQYGHWKRHLHDLGECEVKHGARVAVVNLYTEELGNPEVPQKFRAGTEKELRRWFAVKSGAGAGLSRLPLFSMAALAIGAIFIVATFCAVSLTVSSSAIAGPCGCADSHRRAAVPEKSIAVLPFENLSR